MGQISVGRARVIIQMGVHPHLVNTLDYPHLVQMELVQVGLVQMTHGLKSKWTVFSIAEQSMNDIDKSLNHVKFGRIVSALTEKNR